MGLGSEETAVTNNWGVWTTSMICMTIMRPGMINECRASRRPFSDRQIHSGHQYIRAFRAEIYSCQIPDAFEVIIKLLYHPV